MSKSQMRIDLDLDLEGIGVKRASIGLPEFVAVERQFGIPATELASDGSSRLEPLFYMAHKALRRQGTPGVPSSFDDFLAIVVDIVGEEDDEGEG